MGLPLGDSIDRRFLHEIRIQNPKVGNASLDLVVDRSFRGIGVERLDGNIVIC